MTEINDTPAISIGDPGDTNAEIAAATRQQVWAVVRNGAVWKNHDAPGPALAQAEGVAAGTAKFERYQGFDEHGRSAVVERAVTVRVERLELVGRLGDPGCAGWRLLEVVAEWNAGTLVE